MAEAGPFRAVREAVQPSLWDRLVDDLPGVTAEIDALRQALAQALGPERLGALLDGGLRAIEADASLRPGQKEALARLIAQERARAALEERGIVVSPEVLREAVRRDIEALFNTERLEATPLLADAEREAVELSLDLADFPEVRRSVVNYGVPPFAGHSSRDFDRGALERELRAVLAAFEPRLRESATKVTVSTSDRAEGLAIEIDGLLIMAPAPERLRLRTVVDLDTGRARTTVKDP
jgi:type VI secretion system protein ImpF